MIRAVKKEELSVCLSVLQESYEASAVYFGMTEENCPYRGRTRLPFSVLEQEFESSQMYVYVCDEKIVGFLSLQQEGEILHLNDIALLPGEQGKGFGTKLMEFAHEQAKTAGCMSIRLGMVHDNLRLRNWYESIGFETVKLKKYEKVTYTVGTMEKKL